MSRMYTPRRPTTGDGSYEVYPADAMFPGTVWSVQPAHPLYGIAANGGSLVNGAVIKNAAHRNLARLMGMDPVAQDTLLHGTLVVGSAAASNQIKLELTPKGGLHILMSQANGTINTYAYFQAPQAVADYVCAAAQAYNAAETIAKRRFALVMWIRRTRAYRTDSGLLGNNVAHYHIAKSDFSIGHGSMLGSALTGAPIGDAGVTISNGWQPNVVSPAGVDPVVGTQTLRVCTVNGWSSSPPAAGAAFVRAGINTRSLSSYINACASEVLYRVDLVDLYAGGLEWSYPGPAMASYASRAAGIGQYVDIERFVRDQRIAFDFAFGPDGDYYADTVPTDPATFA